MLPILIDAAGEMDTIFREQAYAAEDSLLSTIKDSTLRRYVDINYGPWDRLDGWAPFVPGVGPRPPGGEFYPHDMTKEEFEAAAGRSKAGGEALRSLYTVVRRDSSGGLAAVPYHQAYRRADPPSGCQAPRGRRPGARSQAPALSRAPGQGPGDRRVPAQRPGLDGHEGQHDRRGHRADRDLRGRAFRLQGGARSVRAGQGPGVEPPARPVHRAPARRCSGGFPSPRRTSGRSRAATPTSTRTTSSTTPATPTPERRPSRSTFPTTRKCSSGAAPAGSSSRTRCGPSSTGSSSPSRTS